MRPLIFVSDGYPGLSQTFTSREVRALHAGGLPVSVVSLHRPGPQAPPWDPTLDPPVTYLPSPFGPEVAASVARAAARRPARFARLAGWCLRRQDRPVRWAFQARAPVHLAWACWLAPRLPAGAHVHAQFVGSASTVAWMAARLAGATFSFRAHAEWTFALGAPKLRDASFALTISDHERERLLARCARRPSDARKVRVERLGIGLRDWPESPEPPLGADGLRVAAVGMLGATKGHDVLVEAMGILRDQGVTARLDIAGEGPERSRLEAIVARLGLADRVSLLGAVPASTVRRLLQDCHAGALACRVTRDGDFDGIPVALMETMATGRPVVTCRVSALSELVEDGVSGRVLPPERPDLVAGALAELEANPALRARLGRGARRRVEAAYDGDAAAARLDAIFREILTSDP